MSSLVKALAEVIGFEASQDGTPAAAGWASEVSKEQLEEWRAKGLELEAPLREEFFSVFEEQYRQLMCKVGLPSPPPSSSSLIAPDPLLDFDAASRID